jgi:hypothetical protein
MLTKLYFMVGLAMCLIVCFYAVFVIAVEPFFQFSACFIVGSSQNLVVENTDIVSSVSSVALLLCIDWQDCGNNITL